MMKTGVPGAWMKIWDRAYRILVSSSAQIRPETLWYAGVTFSHYNQYRYSIGLWRNLWFAGYKNREVFQGMFPLAFEEAVSRHARESGIPVALFYGLLREESHFDPNIGSHAGAVGLSQLMPSTAEEVARRIRLRDYDIRNIEDNLRIGSWYLSHRKDQFENGAKALMAYNAGSGRVRRWERDWAPLTPMQYTLSVPIKETRDYVQKVLVSALWYSKLYDLESPEEIIAWVFTP